jgi:hypothetical protein
VPHLNAEWEFSVIAFFTGAFFAIRILLVLDLLLPFVYLSAVVL